MPKFLIEVPHEAEKIACARAVKTLLNTGSHFLTKADFGCHDGVHNAWITIDVENKEAARAILPPQDRPKAKIVKLNKFSLEELDDLLKDHQG